jgi:formylglycine-generating enzyme
MKIKTNFLFTILAMLIGVHEAEAQVTNLGIVPAGGQSIVYWPASTNFQVSYILQTTADLASPNWVTASNAVAVNAMVVTSSAPTGYFRLLAQTNPPPGMVLIPAGSFIIGDMLDGEKDAIPTNVYVSAFYMDTNMVSWGQWLSVYNYATNYGYSFGHGWFNSGGNSPIPNLKPYYPVMDVGWGTAIVWCNARSQQAGLTPVYYNDAAFTQVLKNGGAQPYANWSANGFRLPTEAEWEKAARGGLSGMRFPWGNTISETNADYYSTLGYSYDLGPKGNNPIESFSGFASPVGSFAPNSYGLYDMAGNGSEWCWDYYGEGRYQAGSPYLGGIDPTGPATGSDHVQRSDSYDAYSVRCAYRKLFADNPCFRCVSRY